MCKYVVIGRDAVSPSWYKSWNIPGYKNIIQSSRVDGDKSFNLGISSVYVSIL
jgi:hypothetical protein